MNFETLSALFFNIWSVCLIIVFFGGSIFVHELGHFLAARRRGLVIERFSIGFGPKIITWKRHGVEYCISLLPLGGYVALPQLGDMQAIEGKAKGDPAKLAPISYADKMIVSVMGAVFNVAFALILATILWLVGQPIAEDNQTTVIGYVQPTLTLGKDQEVAGPAYQAGLQPGDKILTVDGHAVDSFSEIQEILMTGTDRDAEGHPRATITVERHGEPLTVIVSPQLSQTNIRAGDYIRKIGITPAHPLTIDVIAPNSPAERAGLRPNDVVEAVNGQKVFSLAMFSDIIDERPVKKVSLLINRGGKKITMEVVPEVVSYSTPLVLLNKKDQATTNPIKFLPLTADKRSLLESGANTLPVTFVLYDVSKNAPIVLRNLALGDHLTAINNQSVSTIATFKTMVERSQPPILLSLSHEDDYFDRKIPFPLTLSIEPPLDRAMLGFGLKDDIVLVHLNPIKQIFSVVRMTIRVLKGLFSRDSDIGIQHLMGPPGIVRTFHHFSYDLRLVIWFTLLLNVNLAILNLLPIPVLDGGHMLFATITRLRRKPLPSRLIASVQGLFMMMLFSLLLYVSFFDVKRWQGDNDLREQLKMRKNFYITPEFSSDNGQ